ncbi:MAG: hypothetical protein AB7T49_03450 [Oligoflexales bacterium]
MKKTTMLVSLIFCLSCNKVPSLDPKEDEDTSDSTAAAGEGDEVDEPSMIAGSYLTCVIIDEDASGVGCRVDTKHGEKMPMGENVQSDIVAYDAFNRVIDKVVVRDEATVSEWHWYLTFPASQISQAKVQANLTYTPTKATRQLITSVKHPDGSVDQPKHNEEVRGLHIGNWEDPLAEIADKEECVGKNVDSISASGAEVSVPFTIQSENVGLTIELCAVDTDKGAFRIEKEDGTVVLDQAIEEDEEVFALSNDNWGTGAFHLVFYATTQNKGQDYNYIVPSIQFNSDKPITLDDSMVKIPSPLIDLDNMPENQSRITALGISVKKASGGDNLSHYKYKIGKASETDCAIMDDYSDIIPTSVKITDNISGLSDGKMELCIIGHDDSKDPISVVEQFYSETWTKDTVAPTAKVANSSATGASSITGNYIEVEGSGVEKYRYKASTSSAVNCADAAGYGIEKGEDDKIPVTTYPHQQNIYVCVIGRDEAGNWQSAASASKFTVFKNTTAPVPF